MTCLRRYAAELVICLCIAAASQACGKVGSTQWAVGWSYSWESQQMADAPVSRDGRYAYFTIDKYICPLQGHWGRQWISPRLLGRVHLESRIVDTRPIQAGMQMIGLAGYQLADSVFSQLRRDSVPFYFTGPDVRHHGYGDGRYLLLLTRLDTQDLTAFLLDNEGTYLLIGPGFHDGWISTDERSVILVRDTGDTWVYELEGRKLRRLTAGESPPRFLRGLMDLSPEAQQHAAEAMRVIPPDAVFSYYPESEERI